RLGDEHLFAPAAPNLLAQQAAVGFERGRACGALDRVRHGRTLGVRRHPSGTVLPTTISNYDNFSIFLFHSPDGRSGAIPRSLPANAARNLGAGLTTRLRCG